MDAGDVPSIPDKKFTKLFKVILPLNPLSFNKPVITSLGALFDLLAISNNFTFCL